MFFSISYLAAIDGQMKCQTCHPKSCEASKIGRAENRATMPFPFASVWMLLQLQSGCSDFAAGTWRTVWVDSESGYAHANLIHHQLPGQEITVSDASFQGLLRNCCNKLVLWLTSTYSISIYMCWRIVSNIIRTWPNFFWNKRNHGIQNQSGHHHTNSAIFKSVTNK